MRLRKWRIRGSRSTTTARGAKTPGEAKASGEEVKVAKPVEQSGIPNFLRTIVNNPEFPVQLMMVILTMSTGHISMDRKIDTMSTTVETVRNITNLLTNTMQSLKTAAQTPQQIRRMLE